MQKILIATTNASKFAQIKPELADLSFDFVNLKTLKLENFEVEEPYDKTWQNAIEKAKFFAKKTGLITIAEDTGFFIDALKGKPGVQAKRYGSDALERNKKVLAELNNIPDKKRTAYFETAGCVYDPSTNNFSIFIGKSEGMIAKTINSKMEENMGYDAIFYYPPSKKLFSEMEILEKNMVSSRGKMINQVKYFLTKNYEPQQLVCAAGIIVKDKKIFMNKRRDLRPEFNNKWEFPGGLVSNGETFDQALFRELKEETGYKVSKLEQLPDIFTVVEKKSNYQVHLFVCVCSIKSGNLKIAEAESSDYGWFTYQEIIKMDLLPLNKKLIQSKNNKKILLKYIQ